MRTADRLRDHGAGRTSGEGRIHELVPVVHGAGHGDEQIAGANLPTVKRDAGGLKAFACRARSRSGDFVRGPQHAHAAHSRATSASSNGRTLSPMIWPVSWPL